MISIRDAELRGECPHCRQHFVCDRAAAGQTLRCPACDQEFIVQEAPSPTTQPAPSPPRELTEAGQFRCPRCATTLGLFDAGKNPPDCPRCGWHHANTGPHPALPNTPSRRMMTALALVIIGIASPFLVALSMSLTFVTGPLALVLAPIVGIICGNFLCRTVYDQTGPRWYWYYVGSGLVVPPLILLWPSQARYTSGSDFGLGGFLEGLAGLLLVGAVVLWLAAAVYAWFKAHPLD